MSDITRIFAGRVRKERLARGWSVRDLAAQAGVGAATVCRAEKPGTDMWLSYADRIAGAFGLSLGELVTGAGEGAGAAAGPGGAA